MRRSAAVLSALLIVLPTAACSTTVTGNPTASDPSGSGSSAAATAPTTASPGTATDGSDAGSTGAAGAAGGVGAPGSGSFCDAARSDIDQGKMLLDAVTGTGDLNAVIAKIRTSHAALEATAPAAIHDDVLTVDQVSDKELDLLVSSGGNPVAFTQDTGFQQAVRQAAPAIARVSAYLKANCGIDVDSLAGLGG